MVSRDIPRNAIVASLGIFLLLSTPFASGADSALFPHGDILLVDSSGRFLAPVDLTVRTPANESLSVNGRTAEDFSWIIARASWINGSVANPAFLGVSFEFAFIAREWWYIIPHAKSREFSLLVAPFEPKLRESWYSYGSPKFLTLERPMFVSVERFPLEHVQNIAGSGGNGSFSQEVRETDSRLVLNFSSRNRSGQRILLNEAWLRSLGLTEPRFAQQDNTPLDGHS